jgi:putative ABC transport system permease protein
MAGLLMDLRGAWRLLRRYRGTSLLILLTLALGLGANVAIFAAARGVLLRPLPYHEPDRLVMLWGRREPTPPGNTGRGLATPRWFHAVRDGQRTFSSIAAVELWDGNPSATFDLSASGGAERLRGAFATTNLFDTIGVRAVVGRTFTESDAADVAVISHDLWQRLFGGTRDIVGRRLDLATGRGKTRMVRSLTIIGVLPARVQFSYPESTDVWLPIMQEQLEKMRLVDAIMYRIVARLRPGVTLVDAHRDMAAVKAVLAAEPKREYMNRITFWLEPVHEYAVGSARPALRLVGAVSLLVFLVACLNVAALLLSQSAERRREIAVQLAIGASRVRIIRQLVTESTVTALIAAAVSVAAVAVLQSLLRTALPPGIPRADEIGVDLFTIGLATALVALAVIVSTIVPAWRSSRLDPAAELAQSSRTATQSRVIALWRHALVTAQVAIVLVLLVAGGLLLNSFWRLQQVDLGFDGDRVFTAEMRLLNPRYFDGARLRAFQDELLTRVRAIPGVAQASITSSVPLRGVDWTTSLPHAGKRVVAKRRDVDPEYFEVMSIPLLAGRLFTAADTSPAAPVAIVSRSFAETLFPGESPLGRYLGLDEKSRMEIVGVVGDVRNVRIEAEGDPAYYVPRAQQSSELIVLVARTTSGAPDLAPAVRAIVSSIDPMQPVMNATTVDQIVSETIADRRFYALVTLAFAIVTLLLAAAGLYGVTSYGVVARTREIGVRTALGADARRLVTLLVGQGIRPVLAGLAIGVFLAFWAVRFIERFLFDMRGVEWLTFVTAASAVLALGFVACLLPALRASRLAPTVALRHE